MLPGESQREFVAFRNLLLDAPGMRPQDGLELSIAEQYVLAKWKLRRALSAEQVVHGTIGESLKEVAQLNVDHLAEFLHNRERYMTLRDVLDGDDDEDDDEDDDDDEDEDEEDDSAADELAARARRLEATLAPVRALAERRRIPPGATLAMSFTTSPSDDGNGGAFERMGRYQQRLEHSADRALRQLRQLRKDMGVDPAALTSCPFLDPVPAEEEAEQERVEGGGWKVGEDVVAKATTPAEPAASGDVPPAEAPAQNEANLEKSRAGDGGGGTCAQGSRTISVVTPTTLAPRGAAEASRDGKEGADRA